MTLFCALAVCDAAMRRGQLSIYHFMFVNFMPSDHRFVCCERGGRKSSEGINGVYGDKMEYEVKKELS
jgi:hypothetical protein